MRTLTGGCSWAWTMTIEEMEEHGQPRSPGHPDARDDLIRKGGTYEKAEEMALLAARALTDKKGREIRVMEIAELTTLADYFVMATGASNTQINALVDNVGKADGGGGWWSSRSTARAIAAAPGSCWTTAASPSMCLMQRPGTSTAWSVCKPYAAVTGDKRPKFYGLIEFPYPSGQGLHVGHPRPFTAMDIIARKKRDGGL